MLKENGFTLVGTLIGLFVMGFAVAGLYLAINADRNIMGDYKERSLAQSKATELLETFSSLRGAELVSYLNSATPGYRLCEFANLKNHVNLSIANPDPNVNLSPSPLDFKTGANRYYQIQVVDVATLNVVAGDCGTPISSFNYAQAVANNYRFVLTVGVTWVPNSGPPTQPERVALSTVLYRP